AAVRGGRALVVPVCHRAAAAANWYRIARESDRAHVTSPGVLHVSAAPADMPSSPPRAPGSGPPEQDLVGGHPLPPSPAAFWPAAPACGAAAFERRIRRRSG